MEMREAIINLEKTIEVIDRVSNEDKHFNTEYGFMLQQLSYEMYRSAQQLKEMDYIYC
jgi:hypothetical protein